MVDALDAAKSIFISAPFGVASGWSALVLQQSMKISGNLQFIVRAQLQFYTSLLLGC